MHGNVYFLEFSGVFTLLLPLLPITPSRLANKTETLGGGRKMKQREKEKEN